MGYTTIQLDHENGQATYLSEEASSMKFIKEIFTEAREANAVPLNDDMIPECYAPAKDQIDMAPLPGGWCSSTITA